MDIDDVRKIANKAKDSGRYDQATREMQEYLDCLEKHGKSPNFDSESAAGEL